MASHHEGEARHAQTGRDRGMAQWHITVLVPQALPEPEADTIRRTLNDPDFEAQLLREIRRVFRKEATLAKAKVRLSR